MAREFNGPSFTIKGGMNGLKDDECPSEASRMPTRKFINEVEQPSEGDEPQEKNILSGADGSDAYDLAKCAGRTEDKEGSVLLGSMPIGHERRRD